MPWGVAAAAVGAAGSIGGGLLGSSASDKAAKQQQQSAEEALAFQKQMYGTQQEELAPWLQGGQNALAGLQNLYGIGPGGQGAGSPVLSMLGLKPGGGGMAGFDPSTFQGSPGYAWQKQQGMDAITNSAAARGGLGGNTLKALDQYGTGLANQDFYKYLESLNTGWQGLTGGLYSLSGQGANAAVGLGGFGSDFSKLGSSSIGAAGNAAAGGTIGSANALTGGIGGALQNLQTGLQSINTGASPTGPTGGWYGNTSGDLSGYDFAGAQRQLNQGY